MKALLVSSADLPEAINAMRGALARIDAPVASRREGKALRGRNLSAHPEMFGTKAKNAKLLLRANLLSGRYRPIARLAASPKTMYAPWLNRA